MIKPHGADILKPLFVENLEDPKTVLLMGPSGQATKEVIEKLVRYGFQ